MDPNAIRQQLQAEATRRFSGQAPSTVATQPNPSASNPMMGRMAMGAPGTPTPAMPTSGNPMAGATQMMNGSMPMKGGTNIERAMIKRMNQYPPA